MDRRFGAASVVMKALYRTVVVNKELSHNAMLSQDALNLMPTQSNFDRVEENGYMYGWVDGWMDGGTVGGMSIVGQIKLQT